MEKFKTVLIDPPWDFKTFSKVNQTRAASNHYPCMTLAEIFALPVKDVMAKNSVCLMWITNPYLEHGVALLSQYGFRYKTCRTWLKMKDGKMQIATGYHLRGATEQLLIGTRGNGFCPPRGTQPASALIAPREAHSVKPEGQYAHAELYLPPYLELFARRKRDGWVSLGNDIDGQDIRESLPALAQEIEAGQNGDIPPPNKRRSADPKLAAMLSGWEPVGSRRLMPGDHIRMIDTECVGVVRQVNGDGYCVSWDCDGQIVYSWPSLSQAREMMVQVMP